MSNFGAIRSFFFLDDLKVLLGMYGFNSSLRYRGPRSFSTLKTRSSLPKSIRADTGTQCKLLSIGEMCSSLLVAVTRWAAEFCRNCNLSICDGCRPDKSMLQ